MRAVAEIEASCPRDSGLKMARTAQKIPSVLLVPGHNTLRMCGVTVYEIFRLAQAEGISMNQFLVIAAAEKTAALLTEDYLTREARHGKRADFEKVLQAVPMLSQRTTTVSKRP